MNPWNYRFVYLACMPLALAACPTDPAVATSTESSSGSDDSTTSTSTTLPSTSTSTSTVDDSTTQPLTTGTSSSSGSTGEALGTTSESGTDSSGSVVGSSGELSICGNNIIEGDEVCDLNQLSGQTCASLDFQGGVLGCRITCDGYNVLGCFICGNDVVDTAEDCEPSLGIPETTTCQSLGFQAGTVMCGDDCLYDLSECSICGDGIQAGDEDCDGIDFGGETCESLGFEGGNLGCNLNICQFSYTDCIGGQYIEDFEGGILPSVFTTMGTANWTIDNTNPINGSNSARSGNMPAGGMSDLELTADFPAGGDVSFELQTSCSDVFDSLQFHIDGVSQMTWNGLTGPLSFSTPIAAGPHTLLWRFDRAGFQDLGQNAVWIDDLLLSGGVPL